MESRAHPNTNLFLTENLIHTRYNHQVSAPCFWWENCVTFSQILRVKNMFILWLICY